MNLIRLDIYYIVGQLTYYIAKPIKEYLYKTKSVLRYLRKTIVDRIIYRKDSKGYYKSLKDNMFNV